ncbi:kinase-like domain-containing protein [Aspergillus pseudodeflectus]|uniref:Kinase-like domain-containing protein n=1 Tax=Aspergillus pseudodeflectus TaxID=176178 RepID=A0ABR4L6F4_9EURO
MVVSEFLVCMRLRSRGNVDKERTVLATLKASLSHHDHLVPGFATVTSETKYTILFEKTKFTLEQLLSGRMDALPLSDLMAEFTGVADALAFMHERISGGPPHCHMDLNPANIQIIQSGTNPVGQWKWKITGFGLSVTSGSKAWTSDDGEYAGPNKRFHAPELYRRFKCCPQSDNARMFDAAGGRDSDDVVLRTLLAQDWLTDLPGEAPPQLSPAVCGWIRDLLLSAVQVSMRRRPTAREMHRSLVVIQQALQVQASDGECAA